ncbi:hypothetical protein SDC9_209107 [bioreactor metagenome]|uniref:Uncharacterized protein n=1 Tax=bioreactor metagenome TaxID=1076179 RepID=A0A645JCI2_9ZZZZ
MCAVSCTAMAKYNAVGLQAKRASARKSPSPSVIGGVRPHSVASMTPSMRMNSPREGARNVLRASSRTSTGAIESSNSPPSPVTVNRIGSAACAANALVRSSRSGSRTTESAATSSVSGRGSRATVSGGSVSSGFSVTALSDRL